MSVRVCLICNFEQAFRRLQGHKTRASLQEIIFLYGLFFSVEKEN